MSPAEPAPACASLRAEKAGAKRRERKLGRGPGWGGGWTSLAREKVRYCECGAHCRDLQSLLASFKVSGISGEDTGFIWFLVFDRYTDKPIAVPEHIFILLQFGISFSVSDSDYQKICSSSVDRVLPLPLYSLEQSAFPSYLFSIAAVSPKILMVSRIGWKG